MTGRPIPYDTVVYSTRPLNRRVQEISPLFAIGNFPSLALAAIFFKEPSPPPNTNTHNTHTHARQTDADAMLYDPNRWATPDSL